MCTCGLTAGCELCNPAMFSYKSTEEQLSKYRQLLRQYLDGLGASKIDTVAGLYLLGFADWLDRQGINQ